MIAPPDATSVLVGGVGGVCRHGVQVETVACIASAFHQSLVLMYR